MIEEHILKSMYLDQKKSYKTIAKELGCTEKKVQKYIKLYEIPARSNKKLMNIIGKQYSNLTVIKFSHIKNGRSQWLCKCRCGKEKVIDAQSLKNGLTKTCGCLCKQTTAKRTFENLTGQKFDRLTVLERVEGKYTQWKCKCDCGNEIITKSFYLKRNKNNKCSNCPRIVEQSKSKIYEDISGEYFNKLRHGAKIRDLEFNIKIEDIWNLFLKQNKKCALSGQDIVFIGQCYHTKYKLQTASVDRINSLNGYTLDNIQIIHKDINIMKMSLNNEYFIELCTMIGNHANTQNINRSKNSTSSRVVIY